MITTQANAHKSKRVTNVIKEQNSEVTNFNEPPDVNLTSIVEWPNCQT